MRMNKKTFAGWLVAALMSMPLTAMAQVRDTVEFDISGKTTEAITVDGETFSLYSVADCDHVDRTGAPMLPVRYIRLSVPYNATNIEATAAGSWTGALISRRVYPAPVPIPTDGSVTEEPEAVIDSAVYMTDAFWPQRPVEIVSDGFYMGENRIVTVAVYPMLYNPVSKLLRNYSRVKVTISYDLGDTPANMLVRYDGNLRQQEQSQAKSMVANPQQVEAHAVPMSAVQHIMTTSQPDTASQPVPGYEYMVVTTRELAPAFKRLVALKQQKGYRAGVVCVEDILNDPLVQDGDKSALPDGTFSYINDDAGKIRQYLKENFHYGTKYVLFGGKDVPFRYAYYDNTATPSDFYFTNLKAQWKEVSNGNGFDMSNYTTSVQTSAGRILSKNVEDVCSYTNKLFRYELNPGNGETNYLKRAYYFAADDMRENKEYNNVISNFEDIFSLNHIDLEKTVPPYNYGSDIIDEINETKYGFISLHAHGSPNGMRVGNEQEQLLKRSLKALRDQRRVPSPDEWLQEERNGLDFLTNKLYPNVLYSISCSVMPFDTFSLNMGNSIFVYDVYRNMGDSFISGKEYGGVAFLGNTRHGYVGSSAKLEGCFASEIVKGNYHVGSAEAISKIVYHNYKDDYLRVAHNLMGDPEFELWTDEPMQYQHLSTTRNDNSIIINIPENNNSPVTLALNDGITQVMDSTSTDCLIFNDVNPNSTVMVYRHNYLPYIAPLYLQNERITRSQYVIANDVFVGSSVDSNRTEGDLVIASGSEYEIETKGTVTLAPGFKVEKGAVFSVSQSDY